MGDTARTMDFEQFRPMFGLWTDKFRRFIESEDMFNIYQRLKSEGEKGILIPPGDENLFRVFKNSIPGQVKSIWYMMDPYPKRYRNKAFQATGIAMDCSNSPDGKLQPSLIEFYKGMESDLKCQVERSPDLSYLVDQGVMLLNTDLTCKLNKKGSHKGLWEPFQKFFLEEIMSEYSGVVYVLAGKESYRMERYISPLGNHIFKIDHPVSASYSRTTWQTENVFTKTNTILKESGKEAICWDKSIWDAEVPF